MARWLMIDAGRSLGRRTAAAWRTLPGRALAWQLGLTLLAFAVAMGVTAGVTLVCRGLAEDGLHAWDTRQLVLIRDVQGWASILPFGFTDGIIFESPGNILIVLPLTLICAAGALWAGRPLLAIQFVVCYGLGRLLVWTGWWLWARPRPDLVADGAAALSAHSFPSGHAILVLTTYGLLAFVWARQSRSALERLLAAGVLLLLVAVVGYGRLLLGAHWPSDVIAGWGIGLIWLAGNAVALAAAERRGGRVDQTSR